MSKLTKKLIKNFIFIISIVTIISFFIGSIFLSRIYINQQYKELQLIAEEIDNSLNQNISIHELMTIQNQQIRIYISNRNQITPIGKMGFGMMGGKAFINSLNINQLKEKGKINNSKDESFLYYNYNSKFGNILVFKNEVSVNQYLRIVYMVLLIVFILGLLISFPIITSIGKKLTQPILRLKKYSNEIADGNFETDISVKTDDEIQELAESLIYMKNELNKKYTLQRNFVSNVSHDFKTPLSIIRNYSEAINDGLLDSDGIKEFSSEIINEVDRLNLLVVQVMELSKFQSGKMTINKTYFYIDELLLSIKHKFSSIAKHKNINIIVDCIDKAEISGDENAISRVLYNFVQNAIKFSDEDSVIEIVGKKVENDSFKISVKDYGIGIDSAMLDDIWDRYYKHSKSGGMGLGLAISKEILKLHEFEYGVESVLNQGSEFYFTIPNKYIKLNK